MELKQLLKERAQLVASALENYVSETDDGFGVIYDAMRYSLLAGGKRLRPFLVLEFARIAGARVGVSPEDAEARALPFACALEMIHTYSLIHDDLPCMDNDELRRGKPTSHNVFGEANALLAGDALLTRSFGVAAENELVSAKDRCRAVALLSSCAGAGGMIGGQVLDLRGETESFGLSMLERLQSLKTGELIRCACLLGLCAVGLDEHDSLTKAAEKYAMGLGRAFQVTDDILDVIGDESSLGKPIGSDKDSGKSTFVTIMSIEEAKQYADKLTEDAVDSIRSIDGSEILVELAYSLTARNS